MPKGTMRVFSEEVVGQIGRLAEAVRDGEVVPLIGAGFSIPSGLPSWGDLIDRLLKLWQENEDAETKKLTADTYASLIKETFEGNLVPVSYIRQRISEKLQRSRRFRQYGADLDIETKRTFWDLLYQALYSTEKKTYLMLEQNDMHRHLMALFVKEHGLKTIWTSNYDDLLEQAARQILGKDAKDQDKVEWVDTSKRMASNKVQVAHLHGYLPLEREASEAIVPPPDPDTSVLILSEADYHIVATSLLDWTNNQLMQLFDEHRVLIMGMSLADWNVRRVLIASANRNNEQARSMGKPQISKQQHFAVLPTDSLKRVAFPTISDEMFDKCIKKANQSRREFWKQYGVEIVELENTKMIGPFLMRLRYQTYGTRAGALYTKAAELGHAAVDPWNPGQQQRGNEFLANALAVLLDDMGIHKKEVAELGVFLLRPGTHDLELVFRTGEAKTTEEDSIRFSANPDFPQGVAGRVFVTGDVLKVTREDPLHDCNVPPEARRPSGNYEGIVAAPIIDWEQEQDNIPLGVIYLTTKSITGRVFTLPVKDPTSNAQTLGDLYQNLSKIGGGLIKKLKTREKADVED